MVTGRLIAVISVPLLMFSDYFLTIAGKKYRDSEYSKKFTSQEYELNPVWQKDINSGKLFNYKHFLAAFLVTVYFYFASKLMSEELFDFFYGAILIVYMFIITKHLQNIFTFKLSTKHPEYLTGMVSVNQMYSLKISQYQILFFAMFLFVINIRMQSLFLFGGILGMLILYLNNLVWISRYKRKILQQKQV